MQEIVRMEGIYSHELIHYVNFNVLRGEIVGLLGLNNSGKSLVMRILAGKSPYEKGRIYYKDELMPAYSYSQANKLGIYYIQDEKQLLQDFTVGENIFVMRANQKRLLLNQVNIAKNCDEILQVLLGDSAINISAGQKVSDLSILQKLAVLIIKAITLDAKLIIIDHFLYDLPRNRIETLKHWLDTIVRDYKISFVFTHYKAINLLMLCDKISVLRAGMSVGTFAKGSCDEKLLTAAMTANPLPELEQGKLNAWQCAGQTVFAMRHVVIPGYKNELDIDVNLNETVGICCMSDRFADRLCAALSGSAPIRQGALFLDGEVIRLNNPSAMVNHGISLISDKTELFLNMSFAENVSLNAMKKFSSHFGIINNGATSFAVSEALSTWEKPYMIDVGMEIDVQTKKQIVISRALAVIPRVLFVVNFDNGLDSIAYSGLVDKLKSSPIKPKSTVVVSSNIGNLLALCTRIYFVRSGRQIAELSPEHETYEHIIAFYQSFCEL